MNHTQGPWECFGPLKFQAYGGDPKRRIAVIDYTQGQSSEESAANASLIAAAPELLAAAKRALPWLGKLIADGGHLHSVLPKDAEIALDQLQAAIYKATTPA